MKTKVFRTIACVVLAGLLGVQLELAVRAYRAEFYAEAAATARRAGDARGASWAYAKALKCAPFRPEFGYSLGTVRAELGDLEGASRALHASLRAGPNGIHTLLLAAQVDAGLGNLARARALVAWAHRLVPRYWRVAVTEGVIALRAGNPSEAIACLRGALECPGVERGTVMALLASAYRASGDAAQALACEEEAVTLGR